MERGGFKVSGVVLGVALAAGGTGLVALGIALVLAASVFGSGAAAGEIRDSVAALLVSDGALLGFVAVGAGFTGLGGYLAARLEPHAPLLHGFAAGLGVITLGLLFGFDLSDRFDAPAWFDALHLGLAVPCALAGAWLAARQRPAADPPGLAGPLAREAS